MPRTSDLVHSGSFCFILLYSGLFWFMPGHSSRGAQRAHALQRPDNNCAGLEIADVCVGRGDSKNVKHLTENEPSNVHKPVSETRLQDQNWKFRGCPDSDSGSEPAASAGGQISAPLWCWVAALLRLPLISRSLHL